MNAKEKAIPFLKELAALMEKHDVYDLGGELEGEGYSTSAHFTLSFKDDETLRYTSLKIQLYEPSVTVGDLNQYLKDNER